MPDIKQFTIVSPDAKIGANTIVWSFTTIGSFVCVGSNCVIGTNCFVGMGTVIGDESRIQTGVFLPNRSVLEERVFLGPNVVCTDDRYPRVDNHNYIPEPPYFEHDCSLGAGVVVLPGIRIGHHALVGAGAVVTQDVEPYAVVVGNPSRIIRMKEKQDAFE